MAGDDVQRGGDGRDIYVGGDGNDWMSTDAAKTESQLFFGEAGNDTAIGGDGHDNLLCQLQAGTFAP